MKFFETTCHVQSIMDAQFISFHHVDLKAAHIITAPPIPDMSYTSKTVTNGTNLMQFRISIRLTSIKLTVGWKFRLGDYACFKKTIVNLYFLSKILLISFFRAQIFSVSRLF